jgi:hypothetical protein
VWTGTGTASDIIAGTWKVHGTELQRLYCTPDELKSRTGISDTLDDFEILAAFDEYCQRRFYRATETRYYDACTYTEAQIDDLVSVTTLKTDTGGDGTYGTTISSSDYQLLPLNPGDRPYTSIRLTAGSFPTTSRRGAIQLVGVFGWPTVPAQVRQAAAIMSTDALKLGGMAFGAQGYAEFGPMRARPNPIAVSLLDPFRRHAVLVA